MDYDQQLRTKIHILIVIILEVIEGLRILNDGLKTIPVLDTSWYKRVFPNFQVTWTTSHVQRLGCMTRVSLSIRDRCLDEVFAPQTGTMHIFPNLDHVPPNTPVI